MLNFTFRRSHELNSYQILYKSEKNIYDSLYFQKFIFTRIDFSAVQIQSHIPEMYVTQICQYF